MTPCLLHLGALDGPSILCFRISRKHRLTHPKTMTFSLVLHVSRLTKAPMAPSRQATHSRLSWLLIFRLLQTSYNTWYSSLIKPVAAAIANLGFKINEDPNGGDVTGFMNIARTVDGSKGTRQHAGVTYLEETSGRSNISVLLGARATKIVLSGAFGELTATGVEFDVAGAKFTVNATKQVILSAGT